MVSRVFDETYITEWHKKTFPDALESDQRLKLEEELDEFQEAGGSFDVDYNQNETAMLELADCYIVTVSLCCRFNVDMMTLPRILRQLFNANKKALLLAVDKKMAMNLKRKRGEVENGTYHHND